MGATFHPVADTNGNVADKPDQPDPSPLRTIGPGSSVSIGLLAGLVSFLAQLIVGAFWFGGRLESQRREILDEVGRSYVSKEVSETRWGATTATTNAELAIIRRDLGDLRAIAAEIPRISAKLETLQQR